MRCVRRRVRHGTTGARGAPQLTAAGEHTHVRRAVATRSAGRFGADGQHPVPGAAAAAARAPDTGIGTAGRRLRRIVTGAPVVHAGRTPSHGHARFAVWSCTADLLVTDPRALGAARTSLRSVLAAVGAACSRFDPDSELSRLNARPGRTPVVVSELLAELLAAGLQAARQSGGSVDPTVGRAMCDLGYDRDLADIAPAVVRRSPRPGRVAVAVPGWRHVRLDRARRTVWLPAGVQLDLGAIGKAFAADRAAAVIAAECGVGVLVSLGGDIAVVGAPPGGWSVRVTDQRVGPDAHPRGPGQDVAIHAGGLATSSTVSRTWHDSDGRLLHHILDPLTGLPAAGCWRAVSVAAASCVEANTASTAAIVRGEPAAAWLARRRLPARLVHRDGRTVRVAGWPAEAGRAPAA